MEIPQTLLRLWDFCLSSGYAKDRLAVLIDGSEPRSKREMTFDTKHKKSSQAIRACDDMAEKEGFEPSIPLWGIHDFQSCALGRTTRLLHVRSNSFNSEIVSLDIIINISRKVKPQTGRFANFPRKKPRLQIRSRGSCVMPWRRRSGCAASQRAWSLLWQAPYKVRPVPPFPPPVQHCGTAPHLPAH